MGPYNSLGNGAAMRVSAAGLLAESVEDAIALSNRVTEVTHNHPEGLRGGAATAVAIHLARTSKTASEIRQAIALQFEYDLTQTVDGIRPTYRHNERSQDTVPQALICALEATNFEDAIRNAISIGGDSDTIAAIAGPVAEALFGIDDEIAERAWAYLPNEMRVVVQALYASAGQKYRF
jgi:ADP-ribosylglycohydrolase